MEQKRMTTKCMLRTNKQASKQTNKKLHTKILEQKRQTDRHRQIKLIFLQTRVVT